jgi:tetratricopeptide (TPR) repeat protein
MAMTHRSPSKTLAPIPLKSTARPLVWIRILLVVVTLAAFARLCTAEFTNWDDPQTTYANPHLNPATPSHIAWFWVHSYMDIYAPLTFSIWGSLRSIAKMPVSNEMDIPINSWVFHTTNVLLHIAAVLAAFELLRRLVRRNGAAAIGALLFALHPVQVEPVGWVSGMKDVLCGLFSLIALWQYVVYVEKTGGEKTEDRRQKTEERGGGPASHYIAALIALLLALFSKPTAIVTPFMALIIDWWLLRRDWKKALAALWPWLFLSVIFAVVAKIVQPAPNAVWPVSWRPIVAADALAYYLYKLVFPAWLTVDYGRNPDVLMGSSWRYWTWIVPLVAAAGIWLLRKRARWLVAGGLLFLICLLPVLGLVPFDFQLYSTVADHYLYLAMIGPALVAAAVLARWWRPGNVVIACIILAALGTRAFAQASHWQDTLALFRHTLAINPRSSLSHQNLGTYFIDLGVGTTKNAELCRSIQQARLRQGRDADAKQAAADANYYTELAQKDWLKGKAHTEMAVKIRPTWPILHMNLATVMADLGQYDQAMAQLQIVADMKQSYPARVRDLYGSASFTRGMAAYKRHDYRQATIEFSAGALGTPPDILSSHALQILAKRVVKDVSAITPSPSSQPQAPVPPPPSMPSR